jgi:hypothetical protein
MAINEARFEVMVEIPETDGQDADAYCEQRRGFVSTGGEFPTTGRVWIDDPALASGVALECRYWSSRRLERPAVKPGIVLVVTVTRKEFRRVVAVAISNLANAIR